MSLLNVIKSLSVSCLLCFSLSACADDSEALKSKLTSMNAISADFSSVVVHKGRQSSSSGTMALKRPDRFIMHTTSPDETILYTVGDDIYYFDPFVNQLSIFKRSTSSTSPFLLLTDNSKQLWNQYVITKTADGFKAEPKASRDIAAMNVVFKGDLVSSLSLVMKDGTVNTYTLSNVKNSAADSLFKVDIPSDTEIDDER